MRLNSNTRTSVRVRNLKTQLRSQDEALLAAITTIAASFRVRVGVMIFVVNKAEYIEKGFKHQVEAGGVKEEH